MGQQVTKMMPGSLVCMCVIISDVVALLIFIMFLVIAPPPALKIILEGHTEYPMENYRFSESPK